MTARTISADDLETLAFVCHEDIDWPGPEGGWAVAVINGREYRARVAPAAVAEIPGPICRDEHAAASYAYHEALMGYQGALGSRDTAQVRAAETTLREATRRLSAAQTAIVAARQSEPPTFAALLADPTQQLDPDGVVLASIRAYQNATSDTPPDATEETP